jgi:glutamate decarboxylase
MKRETEARMVENPSQNLSDTDEYPVMMGIRSRCVSIIAHLVGAEKGEAAIGPARASSF